MCMFCVQVQQEQLKPKEFWKLYREIYMTEDSKHKEELWSALYKTSDRYQEELAKRGTEE